MPESLFDASTPADSEKAGLGARVIREQLKQVFNEKLGGYVVTLVSGLWECVKGWPRLYVAAASSPPTPPAGAQDGRAWFVSDTRRLKVHDGTAFRDVDSPYLAVVPLPMGAARKLTLGTWTDLSLVGWDPEAGTMLSSTWGTGEGYPFNKALAPSGATIKLRATAQSYNAYLEVRLYDVAAAAEVAGSTLQFPGTEPLKAVTLESADLSSALLTGNRKLRLQTRQTGGSYGFLYAAELVIART